jgi:hypothetical protein
MNSSINVEKGGIYIQKSLAVRIIALVIFILFLVPSLAPAQMVSRQQQAEICTVFNKTNSLAYSEPGPMQQSTLYADGSVIDLQTETITWPILLNEKTDMTQDEFKDMVKSAKNNFDNDPHRIIISKGGSRGLDMQFDVTSPPSGAQAAINAVAAYIESLFSDPVTVVINLGFESMGSGVLGSTSSNYASSVTWTNTRAGLIAGMDSDDTIQTSLPSGSSIPVRYNGNSATVTSENKCYFTKANYRATIGSVSGDAADMTMNTDYNWDYDPSNGITSGYFCFQSVLIHEVGHVLGFTSGADFRYILQDIETLDVYRFQRSDGSGDYNPDSLAEFQTTARMVDQNAPGTSDDVNSDIISVEYQMSDGDPYQCSHFSQGNVYGIMQPAVSSGTTFYPDFYKTPDTTMLDAIGWDYPIYYTLTVSVSPVGMGTVTKDPDMTVYPSGQEVQLTANPIASWEFDQWEGDLSGDTNPASLIMNGNKTVVARFTPDTTPPVTTAALSGTIGQNNWYVSDVTVTLSATDRSSPSSVNHTYYKLDSSPWDEYTIPFVVSADGQHTVLYYSVDIIGNIETEKSVNIKIDTIKPAITLTQEEVDLFTYKFTAEVSDETSGIDRVEFSLNDQLQYSDTQSPYEWSWSAIEQYTVTATVFDVAGNSQSESTTASLSLLHRSYISQLPMIQQLLGLVLRRQTHT